MNEMPLWKFCEDAVHFFYHMHFVFMVISYAETNYTIQYLSMYWTKVEKYPRSTYAHVFKIMLIIFYSFDSWRNRITFLLCWPYILRERTTALLSWQQTVKEQNNSAPLLTSLTERTEQVSAAESANWKNRIGIICWHSRRILSCYQLQEKKIEK